MHSASLMGSPQTVELRALLEFFQQSGFQTSFGYLPLFSTSAWEVGLFLLEGRKGARYRAVLCIEKKTNIRDAKLEFQISNIFSISVFQILQVPKNKNELSIWNANLTGYPVCT